MERSVGLAQAPRALIATELAGPYAGSLRDRRSGSGANLPGYE